MREADTYESCRQSERNADKMWFCGFRWNELPTWWTPRRFLRRAAFTTC